MVFAISTVILLVACIDKIDLNLKEEADYLVVDGGVFFGDTLSWVRLSRVGPLNKRVFQAETQAEIVLSDQTGFQFPYQEIQPGYYVLNNSEANLRLGRAYQVKIKLRNGEIFQSDPEILNATIPLDSLSYRINIEEKLVNNAIITQRNVSIDALCKTPDVQSNQYFKLNYERVYILTEFKCHPLKPIKVCYIYDSSQVKYPILFASKQYLPGSSVRVPVTKIKIDYSLAERNSFKVSIESLTVRAYNYFVNLANVLNSGASIYDVPPAELQGNVQAVQNNRTVLGYFRATSTNNKIMYTTNGNFPLENFPTPFCGVPGFPITTSFDICCDCLKHPFSSYLRPKYWD